MKKALTFLTLLASQSIFWGCGSADEDINFFETEDTGQNTGFQFSNSPASEGNSAEQGAGTTSEIVVTDSPATSPTSASTSSSTVIKNFIWKPKSEKNGKLVVLVNPTNVRIEVTGSISETLSDFGPSNGKGTTARGSFAGCSYGSNVKVEFFNSSGARINVSDGSTKVTVPNGCNRKEF